jgi:hypothetical protein
MKNLALLENVARERLVTTEQAEKKMGLSGCCGDLRIVEISIVAVIARSSESCVYK